MKRLITVFFGVTLVALAHAADNKPNIVITFNDDMGYTVLSCFGADEIIES